MCSSFPVDVFLWKIVSLYSKYIINIPFVTPQNQRHVGSKCQYNNFSLVRKTVRPIKMQDTIIFHWSEKTYGQSKRLNVSTVKYDFYFTRLPHVNLYTYIININNLRTYSFTPNMISPPSYTRTYLLYTNEPLSESEFIRIRKSTSTVMNLESAIFVLTTTQ